MNKLSLTIDGDYLDSFIYSGVLFLVDFNSNLNIINWKNLLEKRLCKEKKDVSNIYKPVFLTRTKTDLVSKDYDLHLSYKELQEHIFHQINLDFLPTNVNILSNVIYFSSSKGISYIPFCGKKRFTKEAYEKHINIFNDCKVFDFDIDNGRGVFCAGSEGALFAKVPDIQELGELKNLTISNNNQRSYWIDCQWINENNESILNINSDVARFTKNYKSAEALKKSLKDRVENLKKKKPNKSTYLDELLKKGYKEINYCLINEFSQELGNDFNISKLDSGFYKYRVVPQVAKFQEINNSIIIEKYSEKEKIEAVEDLVNWRVFPKAKTHSNQLHLVDNDFIRIFGLDIPSIK